MNSPLTNENQSPVILRWSEMVKKAERDGVDIMDYVNSMHAHVLNQRDALKRQNAQIEELHRAIESMQNIIGEWMQWFGSIPGVTLRSQRALDRDWRLP